VGGRCVGALPRLCRTPVGLSDGKKKHFFKKLSFKINSLLFSDVNVGLLSQLVWGFYKKERGLDI
jgi:hypothetical protein